MIKNNRSGTLNPMPSERECIHGKLARKAAVEGIVLLKNEDILPLSSVGNIALFGRGAEKTVKGGIGSGDVNNRENISIYRGLKEAGANIVSENWIADYKEYYDNARKLWRDKIWSDFEHVDNPFDAYSSNPFILPEARLVTQEDIKGAELAIYVISRISGEGKDRRKVQGDYYLSKNEYKDLKFLNEKNIPIILIINAGGPIELTDVLEKMGNVKAILNVSELGQEGGYAISDVLYGEKAPAGRLTTTWAKRYEDYPSAEGFSYLNGDVSKEVYKEGIFVGYRHFDKFDLQPLFPFGYGLSYTDFSIEFQELLIVDGKIEILVKVKNMGKHYSGKEVVQVYTTLPEVEMAKECRRLVGFVKTKELAPLEEQNVKVIVEQKSLASFSENINSWVIEDGNYCICVGKHIDSLEMVANITISKSIIIEENYPICKPYDDFSEVKVEKDNNKKYGVKEGIPSYIFEPKKEVKKKSIEHYEKDLSIEECMTLLCGNIAKERSALGIAGINVPGSAGETTSALWEKYNIPSLIMADGPAGIRLRQSYDVDRASNTVHDIGPFGALENGILETPKKYENADTYYQYCTAFPVGTALAQTWDVELMMEIGEAIAREMEEFYIDLWLAPGMNIHRNPLCGRNFEYFSEDPLLTGKMAAAVTRGVQQNGKCGVTIKHFACNNQEDNRMGVDVWISQRALREIYLRGFEIAIKESEPVAIMSSYNLINGVHAANCRDICTVVARDEWGFEGVIMSDWDTTGPEDGSEPWKCSVAGNDIIMPGVVKDEINIKEAYASGKLKEEVIRKSAGRVLALIKKFQNC